MEEKQLSRIWWWNYNGEKDRWWTNENYYKCIHSWRGDKAIKMMQKIANCDDDILFMIYTFMINSFEFKLTGLMVESFFKDWLIYRSKCCSLCMAIHKKWIDLFDLFCGDYISVYFFPYLIVYRNSQTIVW